MNLYELKETPTKPHRIHASRQWGMPGVTCTVCGQTWGNVGLEYPSVNLTDFPYKDRFVDRWPVSTAIYQELEKLIKKAFPNIEILEPGTGFGQLVGTVEDRLEGFVWNMPWSITLTNDALQKLQASRLLLPTVVNVDLGDDATSVLEFALPLQGHLANGVYDGTQTAQCVGCGRDSVTLPEKILVDSRTVEGNFDIFRLRNFSTLVLVTERFVDEVKRAGIKGAIFAEVKVI